MLLDTSFLIDLLRGNNPNALEKAKELDNKFERKSIASISIMELWRGAMQSHLQEIEKRDINNLLSSLLIHPFNENEAKKAGEVEAELKKSGKMIDLEDIMIAGIALVHNEIILTRNKKHFSKIKGINIESY